MPSVAAHGLCTWIAFQNPTLGSQLYNLRRGWILHDTAVHACHVRAHHRIFLNFVFAKSKRESLPNDKVAKREEGKREREREKKKEKKSVYALEMIVSWKSIVRIHCQTWHLLLLHVVNEQLRRVLLQL